MRTRSPLGIHLAAGTGDLDGDVYSIITTANEDLLMVDAANPGEYEGASQL
jgi:hypothetical protein